MKKLYTFALAMGFIHCAQAQVLNQSAGWPNAAWTITGTYNSDPLAFESSPITTANFAYDDDDAGNSSHEDNIAAESLVIDLTAAFAANEKKLVVTADYGYRYLADDVLKFQYWDADAATWVNWGGNIPGNNTSVTDNFCTIPKTLLSSSALDVSNFTPTQLTGFKYRISYDDSITGSDWNYGFCFSSPTIKSVGCEAPAASATNVTWEAANISWAPISGVAGFEYVLDNSASDPVSGTETVETTFTPSDLTAATLYYFHIRTNCGGAFSVWTTIQFTTLPTPPANDACSSAIAIASFPFSNTQDAATATNNAGFISACSGMNDGVWYTFTGNGGDITITVENVGPWDPELGIFTGVCGQFQCVGQKDSAGSAGSETYTVIGSVVGTSYFVNVGHYSGSSDNSEGLFTLSATSTVLGAPSFNDAAFSAFPNPVKNTLNLSYNENISEVIVFNLLGQKVLAKSIGANQAQVDFSTLSQGAYLVKVVSGDATKTVKIIKQ